MSKFTIDRRLTNIETLLVRLHFELGALDEIVLEIAELDLKNEVRAEAALTLRARQHRIALARARVARVMPARGETEPSPAMQVYKILEE